MFWSVGTAPPAPRLLDDHRVEFAGIVVARREIAALQIARPSAWAIRSTRYLLERVDGRLVPLTHHWLRGAETMAWALEASKLLGVPLVDPEGERRRGSTWRCVRWLGSGEDYKLIVPTWGLAGLVGAATWGLIGGCAGLAA